MTRLLIYLCRLLMIYFAIRRSCAWAPRALSSRPVTARQAPIIRTFSSRSENLEVDDQGRVIRRRRSDDSGGSGWDDFEVEGGSRGRWDDFDPRDAVQRRPPSIRVRNNSTSSSGGGWDDYDDSMQGRPRPPWKGNRVPNDRNRGRENRSGSDRNFRYGSLQRRDDKKGDRDRRVNLKALEGAGFVHLYGLSSCLNALQANRRDFTRPESVIDLEQLEGSDLEHERMQRERKPEAQFSPWLFVQERTTRPNRNADKAMAAEQVERLAKERDVPTAYVDKGVLNTLSGNRPHQGYVLRCGALSFEPLSRIPLPEDADAPRLWLVLDEVVDPQNLGALLRSTHFLGNIGVLVCSKNSAPPSPVVSAASAGALELTDVFSTSSLPRTLYQAQEDGFRVIGASSSAPPGDGASLYTLNELPPDDRPTILVLGSEGSGLRTLVARACSEFVRVPGGNAASIDEVDASGVDSLNVSVTGGIILWHLLNQQANK